jgi:hypothetical protein
MCAFPRAVSRAVEDVHATARSMLGMLLASVASPGAGTPQEEADSELADSGKANPGTTLPLNAEYVALTAAGRLRLLVAAGVVVGLLPLLHPLAFLGVVIVTAVTGTLEVRCCVCMWLVGGAEACERIP